MGLTAKMKSILMNDCLNFKNMKNPVLLFVLIFSTFMSHDVFAQNISCNYLSDLIPDANNEIVINRSDLLGDDLIPNEDLFIRIYHPDGSLIAEGTDSVTITNTDAYVGIYLRDTIINPLTGEMCSGQIWIRPSTGFGCNGNELILTPDANDEVRFTPAMLLDSFSNLNRSYEIEIFNPGPIWPGGGIVAGIDEVILTNASQHSGTLVLRIADVLTGDRCTKFFMNLNPAGGINCPQSMEITVDSVCMVSFPPRDFTSDPLNSNVNFGAILGSDGNPIWMYSDWIFANLSNISNMQLTGIAIDASDGDNCTTQIMINDPFLPVPVCYNELNETVIAGEEIYITPDLIDAGSYDNCGDVTLQIFQVDANNDPILPATDSIIFSSNPMSHAVGLEVTDIHGNSDYCLIKIKIFEAPVKCINDSIKPIPVCKNDIDFVVLEGTQLSVSPSQINEGSYDDCGDVTMKIFQVDADNNPILPASDNLIFPSTSMTYTLGLEVTDLSGNSDFCLLDINIIESFIQLTCIDSISYSVDQNCQVTFTPEQIIEGVFSPSTYQIILSDTDGNPFANGFDSLLLPDANMYFFDYLNIQIFDTQIGETCSSVIIIEDKSDPVPICLLDTVYSNPTLPLTISVNDIDFGSYDNCTIESMQIAFVNQGISGAFADSLLITNPNNASYNISLSVTDESGNEASCLTRIIVQNVPPPLSTTIGGNIFEDNNGNCTLDTGEPGTGTWNVAAVSYPSNTSGLAQADASGAYTINHQYPQTDTLIKVFLLTPMNLTQHCPNTFCFDLTTAGNNITADFAIQTMRLTSNPCSQLVVDISTSHLTRCEKSTYTVNYCNYGNIVADDGKVEVTLDKDLAFLSSTLPVSSSNSNIYTFDLGDIEKGDCGSFEIDVEVDCDALLGQAHPMIAKISPSEYCDAPDPSWSGASVKVDGECIGDSIVFTITNVGDEDMIQALNYIVIEDVILHKQGTFDLLTAAQLRFSAHGKGNTCRLEAEQVPGHPGNSFPAVAVEGCGVKQDGSVSLGFVTQFSQDDADYFRSIHIRENEDNAGGIQMIAIPKGIDSRHFIQPNKDIEYLIRFPNNGIAPINNAEIIINLPEELELASIIPGASSHEYRFEVTETGEVKLVFENLAAPPNDWIYAKYKVSQKSNLPNGTMIFNEAKISFGDGSTTITNETFHEVSDNFLTISNIVNLMDDVSLKVAPNPFVESTTFELKGIDNQRFTLNIFDVNGKILRTEIFQNLNYTFQRNGLMKGIYFFNILSEKGIPIVSGKLNPTD